MAVEWREHLAVGVHEIDDRHKELFSRFNSFLQACSEGRGPEDVHDMLRFLDGFAGAHFCSEERLQKQMGYPSVAEHQAHHRSFLNEIEGLKQEAVGGSERNLGLVLITCRTVVEWLVSHVSKMDRAFGQYLKETQDCTA